MKRGSQFRGAMSKLSLTSARNAVNRQLARTSCSRNVTRFLTENGDVVSIGVYPFNRRRKAAMQFSVAGMGEVAGMAAAAFIAHVTKVPPVFDLLEYSVDLGDRHEDVRGRRWARRISFPLVSDARFVVGLC